VIVEKMHNSVCEYEPDIDIRIGFQELRNDGQNVHAPEDDGRSDNEIAFWCAIFAAGSALGFADLFQDSFAGGDISMSRICQCQLAGRSREKPCPQMIFEIGDFAADCRQRHAEAPAGGRKAT
jgi:hypothetical protein